MDIHARREKRLAGQYQVSQHADVERVRDNLAIGDLVAAILSGEIIDKDVDASRGTEYLVEGSTWNRERLRVKVGIDDEGEVGVITVYRRKRGRTQVGPRRRGKP